MNNDKYTPELPLDIDHEELNRQLILQAEYRRKEILNHKEEIKILQDKLLKAELTISSLRKNPKKDQFIDEHVLYGIQQFKSIIKNEFKNMQDKLNKSYDETRFEMSQERHSFMKSLEKLLQNTD